MTPESFEGVVGLPSLVWFAIKVVFFSGVAAIILLEIHKALKGPQSDHRNELYETRRKRESRCPKSTSRNRSSQ